MSALRRNREKGQSLFQGEKGKEQSDHSRFELGLVWGCRNGIKRREFITLAIQDGTHQ